MAWYAYFAYLFAGALFANGVPHFVNGISGRSFQSPFAWPPGVGESSPLANVIWGFFNLVVSFVLLSVPGDFVFGLNVATLLFGAGALATSIGLAAHFGRVRRS